MAKPLDYLKKAGPEKTSKIIVVYMDGTSGPFRCDHCEYFHSPNRCEKVEGNIDPAGCCNLYDPKEEGEEE